MPRGRGTSKYWLRIATPSVDVLLAIRRRDCDSPRPWPRLPSTIELADDEEADVRVRRSDARLSHCIRLFEESEDDSVSTASAGLGEARPEDDDGDRERERGEWKRERTLSTTERERLGTASLPRWMLGSVPLGDTPGVGIGRGKVSTGLGRTDEMDEQRDTPGGESSVSGSGLWTSGPVGWSCCSAFICAIAVEIAGAIELGGLFCRLAASVLDRKLSPPDSDGAGPPMSPSVLVVA